MGRPSATHCCQADIHSRLRSARSALEALDTTSPRSLSQSAHKLLPYFAGCGRRVVVIVSLALAGSALAALEPLVMKRLFDALFDATHERGPWGWFALLAIVVLGSDLLHAGLDWLVWRVRLDVDYALMRSAVERLHALPLAFHREQNVGATMTKIERGISGCMVAFSDVVTRLLPACAYLVISIIVMIQLEWRLALAVLVLSPLPAWLGARAAHEQSAREQSLLERWTRLFGRFNEVLSGIVVVKSFVMEEREKERFLSGVHEANQIVLRGVATDARTNALKDLSTAGARLVALGLGALLVIDHAISVGTLIAFVGYLAGVFRPVQALTGLYQTLRRAAVALDALLSVLEARDRLDDAPDAREASLLSGHVEFRQLGFHYSPERKILHDINLQVHAGETVALVGPSGAGKTTLMALMQRLYDPAHGAILIDGIDVRAFKQRSLRNQIGVVLQEGSLFSDSARDNIAFGRPGASQAEIEVAARAANAHEFIMALPHGYDTLLGERGCKLSGGEKQRIAIARALLKNAPILILDEATSALDAESEAKVQEALSRLIRGRTTFVIAHRLSTIVGADRIAVVRDGRIAELGNHAELMQSNGYYAALIKRQLEGLLASAA